VYHSIQSKPFTKRGQITIDVSGISTNGVYKSDPSEKEIFRGLRSEENYVYRIELRSLDGKSIGMAFTQLVNKSFK